MAYTEIDRSDLYFNTKLYTGNGSTQSINGIGFQPDWIWIKNRDDADSSNIFDSVRGSTKVLFSDQTTAEIDTGTRLTSFDTDGFSINSTSGQINFSGEKYASWNWLASNTTASNTDGSITSTVSANVTSGFSIVSYTGTGSVSTVGHGLGTAPKLIFFKDRETSVDWGVYSETIGNGNELYLSTNDEPGANSGAFNSTSPTSSVFTIGTSSRYNPNNKGVIAYCFAPKKGFSKFGKFTATSSTDGPFVYTGFKPAFILVKGQTGTNWLPIDNARDTINPRNNWLRMNTAAAEFSPTNKGTGWDFLSNGFKVRNWNQDFNDTGSDPYYYWAFAENPFVSSTGTPVTAV